MFAGFFLDLRTAGVPVSLREYLTLIEAMDAGLAEFSVDDFYFLSRACLIKDEKNLDRFDRVFGATFKGLESAGVDQQTAEREIPAFPGDTAFPGDRQIVPAFPGDRQIVPANSSKNPCLVSVLMNTYSHASHRPSSCSLGWRT